VLCGSGIERLPDLVAAWAVLWETVRMIGYTVRVGSLLLWHASTGKRAVPDEAFVVRMRAWPWLCDAYRHLNNAVYLRLAEDARWAWTARTPLLKYAIKRRWAFLVGSADVVYRRPIGLMKEFDLVCRLEGVDERWLYFSQEFVLPSGKSACRILVRAMIRGPEGPVSPDEVLSLVGMTAPKASEELQKLKALGDAQIAKMRDERSSGL
jgi:acyl-CoA thioesterase FadM